MLSHCFYCQTQYFDAYVHAQTAAGRRAREPRWHPRKMVRTVFGHRLADVGLPPPLKVAFCDQNAKPRKGGGTSQDSSSSSLEQQAEAEEAAAKVTSLSAAADQLEGFSGREISKLMIALQSVRVRVWHVCRYHVRSLTLLLHYLQPLLLLCR